MAKFNKKIVKKPVLAVEQNAQALRDENFINTQLLALKCLGLAAQVEILLDEIDPLVDSDQIVQAVVLLQDAAHDLIRKAHTNDK